MTNVERKESIEQKKGGISTKERAILKYESPETQKLRNDSINNANEQEKLRKQLEKTKRQLENSKRLDRIEANLKNRNNIIQAINELKNEKLPISFNTMIKRRVITNNYDLCEFKWNNINKSEFSIGYTDSLGNHYQKQFRTPSKGEISVKAVFKYLANDIRNRESTIYQNKAKKEIINATENFSTENLSPKIQAYLKKKNYLSTFSNTLDFKTGRGTNIIVDKGFLNVNNLGKIKVNDIYKNGKVDNQVLKNQLSIIFDKNANHYFLSEINKNMNNLSKNKSAITDSSYKNSLNLLETSIKEAQKYGINIPANQINYMKQLKEKVETQENYLREDKYVKDLYDKYNNLIDQEMSLREGKNVRDFVYKIARYLETGTLAASDGKSNLKGFFDKAARQKEYQNHVQKFKQLAQSV